jgi:hypothetical protein
MRDNCTWVTGPLGVTGSALLFATILTITPAQADTTCKAAPEFDGTRSTRLISVTAESYNGTITGTPVGGGDPVTLWGENDAYQKSEGFGDAPPDAVRQWDENIDWVNRVRDPNDPNWYGDAKATAFFPRTQNSLASELPVNSIVVSFGTDHDKPCGYKLYSIQPVAPYPPPVEFGAQPFDGRAPSAS